MQSYVAKVKELGWNIQQVEDTVYQIGKECSTGYHFSFTVACDNDPEIFVRNLYEIHDNFDEAYECLVGTTDMETKEACETMFSAFYEQMDAFQASQLVA